MKRIIEPRYIWQQPDWPRLRWDAAALLSPLGTARRLQGRLAARVAALGLEAGPAGDADILSEEVLTNSAIEGERLDAAGVRSSVARHLDLPTAGLPEPGPREEGAVAVLLDAVRRADAPLDAKRLFSWHAALFPSGYSGLRRITVGAWRGPAPMRVVSGRESREVVHFEAPPHDRVPGEMDRFFAWWREKGGEPDGLVRAGLAHLYFVTIHPFEDGNGRLARTLTDMALAQDDGSGLRPYSLSARILAERKDYYEILERTQKGGLAVTDWLVWFLGLTARALERADTVLDRVSAKAAFWRRAGGIFINARQRKALNRLLDAGDAFEGGLTTRKYMGMTGASRATAYRDMAELVAAGLLLENPGGGRNASYRVAV
uniref:Fido domain-containing protein n=1 Tax=Desulfovibrio sp. U5L TaxID=596152 RepID=I2PY68_9BACT